MFLRRLYLIGIIFISLGNGSPLIAGNPDDRILVGLTSGTQVERFLESLYRIHPRQAKDLLVRRISEKPCIVKMEGDGVGDPAFMSEIRTLSAVRWVSPDRPLESRLIPNDAFIGEQWHLKQIQAFEAWNITSGGLSPLGDTLVVAVLDDGFFIAHEDLKDNIWKNYGEIPGDGIDNDDNGYVDDFAGLNARTGKDDHAVRKHGTAVAGIIGASGNNGLGGSGVNWTIKLLVVSEANSLGNLLEAYQYIIDMRKRYVQSEGTEGAYIVATNLSAGIDGVFPEDDPLFKDWCELYNTLGENGILNVNATTNRNSNIDLEGDMPGTCPSDYLITVTNSDQQDAKVTDAGYGLQSVDLSAPGEDIFTISLDDEYALFNGASSSAPQVTGAVALLHASPCLDFALLAKEEPSVAAIQIKNMILNAVDPSVNLASYVKSGGRLNVFNAIARLRDFCGGTTGDLAIYSVSPNPARLYIDIAYETEHFDIHRIELFNALGQLIYRSEIYPDFFGEKTLTLDLSGILFSTGIYWVSLTDGKTRSTKPLLITP